MGAVHPQTRVWNASIQTRKEDRARNRQASDARSSRGGLASKCLATSEIIKGSRHTDKGHPRPRVFVPSKRPPSPIRIRSPSATRGRRMDGSPMRVPGGSPSGGDICGMTCEDKIFGTCTRSCIRPPNHKGGPHVCFPCEEANIKTGIKPAPSSESSICAASKRNINAFTIVGAWLLDTGCPDDLVSRETAIALAHFFRKCIPREWHSANGAVTCDSVLPISIPDIGDKNTEVYIMQDTPALLSIGKRVIHRGYSFLWLSGKRPLPGHTAESHYSA